MKKSILALIVFGGLAQSAFAAMGVGLWSGTTSVIVSDGGAGDLAPGTVGTVIYSGTVNGWTVNVVTGVSYSPSVNPIAMDLGVIASCASGNCVTQDLFVAVQDTAFTQSANSFNTFFSATITGAGTASQKAYDFATAGPTGNPFSAAPTGAFATLGPIGAPGGSAIASGGGPKSGTYALTLFQQFHGAGNFSSDGNITAVPEPGGVLLLGTGLLAAGAGLRRKLQSRG